tara:strand:- start:490 stop:678 length:189 start_codon:yes stop_codon:yes gene_type:complete
MKVEVKESEIKSLKQEANGKWAYYIRTKNFEIKQSGFPDTETAIKDVEMKLAKINKEMLKNK